MASIGQAARFLREFLRAPSSVGAIAPSSKHLARAMIDQVGLASAASVVEFGPGTGVFTSLILDNIPNKCKFFTIERSPNMAEMLRDQHPDLTVYNDSAANVKMLCDKEGITQVDCIVSGLPWAIFPDELQIELLEAIMEVLSPDGRFVTFAYLQGVFLPAGHRFRQKLDSYFSEVGRSKTVWRNLPPAFVYKCKK